MTIRIRSNCTVVGLPHCFAIKDAVELGLEKAAILGNLYWVLKAYNINELHLAFPYIEKKKFYRLFSQLIADGYFVETNDTDEMNLPKKSG